METPTASESSANVTERAALSLRFPLLVLGGYWAAYVAAGVVGMHMFPKFLFRLAITLLCGLVLLVAWLRTRRFTRRARWSVVGLLVGGGVLATVALDKSVMPPIAYMWSLPAIMTLGVLWLAFARRATPSVQFLGLAAMILISWLPGPLVRMEGLTGDGSNDVYWRWSPSAEEVFLRQLPQTAAVVEASDTPLELQPGDWHQFRGPEGNSRVAGLVIEEDWNRRPPKLVWKHAIGPAWSSTIIVGDRVFTQEQRGEVEVISCYSAENGKQLWAYETRDRFEEPLGGVGPRATPAFAQGRIFALSARGRLDCVDAETGGKIWSVDALADNQGQLPMWGYSGSPLVVDDKVTVFVGGEETQALVAYDLLTGQRLWRAEAGVESYSSPTVVTIHGTRQVLYLGQSKLVSVLPESGEVLWEFASSSEMGRPTCQPQLVGTDRILASFDPGSLLCIQVTRQGDRWNSEEVWLSRDLKPDFSDFVVHEDYIYGFDGNIFCCVDLQSGKRKWKKGRFGAGQALLLADMPAILISTEQGELVLLGCVPEKYTELARWQAIEGNTWNQQAICRGRLYMRNAEELACVELPAIAPSIAATQSSTRDRRENGIVRTLRNGR